MSFFAHVRPDSLRHLRTIEALLVPLASGFLAAAWLTPASMWVARRLGAVARPTDRGLHLGEVPRLGGVALGVTILVGTALLLLWPSLEGAMSRLHGPNDFFEIVLLGAASAMLLGALDDLYSLPALVKLAGQAVVAWIPVHYGLQFLVWPVPTPGAFHWNLLDPLQGKVMAALWIVFFINAFNFMDGIDGQAAMAALLQLAVYLGVVIVLPPGERAMFFHSFGYFLHGFLLLAIGALVAFLFHNWPRASVFLGDSGSYFLGYLLAVLPLYLVQRAVVQGEVFSMNVVQEHLSFIGALIVASPLLFDVILTLGRRLLKGHSPLTPHRDHLYQRLVMAGMDHRAVLILQLPFFAWNALLGLMAMTYPHIPYVQWGAIGLAAVSWLYYTIIVRTCEATAREERDVRARVAGPSVAAASPVAPHLETEPASR